MPRRFSFMLSAVLLWSSAVLSAQEPRSFGDSDKLAIEQMLNGYSQAFLMKDYTKLREYVQAPFFFFPAELRILDSVDAVAAYLRRFRESLDQRSFDHGEIVEKRVIALAADQALLNAAYRRYKRDGSLLEEQAAVYLVSKSSGTWKMCGVMIQDLKYFGKSY